MSNSLSPTHLSRRLDDPGSDADVHAHMLEEWSDPASRHYRDPEIVERALDYWRQTITAMATMTDALERSGVADVMGNTGRRLSS